MTIAPFPLKKTEETSEALIEMNKKVISMSKFISSWYVRTYMSTCAYVATCTVLMFFVGIVTPCMMYIPCVSVL